MDKTQLTALLQFIKNAPDNDSLTATILSLAADSISLDTLKSLAGSKTAAVSTPQKEPDSDKASGYLQFSKKELSDMPKSFQKSFIYDNRIVKIPLLQRSVPGPLPANRATTSKSLPKISTP